MSSIQDLREQFLAKTQGSRRIFERARRVLPGGAARGATAFQPYPLYARRASGVVLTDVDGNEYLDFNLEGGSCILGHCAPQVIDRVKSQLEQAEVVSLASELEVELAERIARYIPCVEMMRFVNSGSEACAIAARIARAFTRKPCIAMFEGHHHGQLDTLLFSHYSPPAGPPQAPETVCDSLGMPAGSSDLVLMLPFNDTDAAVTLIKAHADRLAAVFLEPLTVFGGAISAEKEFVIALRRVTQGLGILLVVDEVPTGVRIGPGGAVSRYGITPDLFITGKALAGGLPIGMYGGRRDILEPLTAPPYHPSRKALSSGTFSGNPMVMAACLAVMDALESGEVHHYINRLGDEVRRQLRDVGQSLGIPFQVTGDYSIFGAHFVEGPIHGVRQCQRQDIRQDFALALMANGILWPSGRIAGFLSSAHTNEHIERFVDTSRRILKTMFMQSAPHRIGSHE
jgi:glutamate-1-semialdehyde 2,1-aminomutase